MELHDPNKDLVGRSTPEIKLPLRKNSMGLKFSGCILMKLFSLARSKTLIILQ